MSSMELVRYHWMPSVPRCWRAVCFLLGRAPLAAVAALTIVLGAAAHSWAVALVVCLTALVAYLATGVALSDRARGSVRALRRSPIPSMHRESRSDARRARLWARLTDPATAREAAFALAELVLVPIELVALVGWAMGAPLLIAAPLLARGTVIDAGPAHVAMTGKAWLLMAIGCVVLAGGLWAVVAVAGWHAAAAERLLGPRGEQLRRHLMEIKRSRTRLVDAFDVERRRIERDLHDGAQQQLVALAMKLDLARMELERSPNREAARLLDEAHAQATDAISGLRELIWGIHPPALIDRGLSGALEHLADNAPLPVDLRVVIPNRLPEAIETAAYFIASEALANAAKHSHASRVEIDAHARADRLMLTITDDGIGGADPAAGTGLGGLRDRVAALDGQFMVASPPGGPTRVRAELDYRSDAGA
jgi:signal transduction histidine kinase